MLRRLIEQYGADHVVLGSDDPCDMADDDPLGTLAQVARLPRARVNWWPAATRRGCSS